MQGGGKVEHGATTLVMTGLQLKANNDLIARETFKDAHFQWLNLNSTEYEAWLEKKIAALGG